MNLLPLDVLGAVESNGVVTFGIWLPWVSAADGNTVTLKIVYELNIAELGGDLERAANLMAYSAILA